MSKIAFFSIPAHGHTNPTLAVVKELIETGNTVRYYSYNMFKEKIESTGATFISCDKYTHMPSHSSGMNKLGTDLSQLMKVMIDTTLSMDDSIVKEVKEWNPDVIVGDSMALWAKFAAKKYNIPFVSSTTTFAFNNDSMKIMKPDFFSMIRMIISMQKVKKSTNKLKKIGYSIKSPISLMKNDNNTNTIVYTSPEFQPHSESFSNKFKFIGPLIRPLDYEVKKPDKSTIYISLGTVTNNRMDFFKNCIKAFENTEYNVIISVGNTIHIKDFGKIPHNITVKPSVNQMEVLQQADAFITHCGMNSVNEALYYEVPLVLYPQTLEQRGVGNRVKELNAGIFLEDDSVHGIQNAIDTILNTQCYKENAKKVADSFHKCGGAKEAAHFILETAANL